MRAAMRASRRAFSPATSRAYHSASAPATTAKRSSDASGGADAVARRAQHRRHRREVRERVEHVVRHRRRGTRAAHQQRDGHATRRQAVVGTGVHKIPRGVGEKFGTLGAGEQRHVRRIRAEFREARRQERIVLSTAPPHARAAA